MVSNQQFRLKWNNHRNTVLQEFETLLHNNSFVDCTIGADGKYLKAHKIVLSACSPYLQNVFSEHFDKHPVILLKDVSFKELKCMIDYMYCGEVNISECELPSFLRTAQSLKIKGLAEDINEYDDSASDNEHQEISSLTENGRTVEPSVEIHDDEGPPSKRSAPSLIYSNFAGRKRKSPNAISSGAPKTSNNGDKIIPAPTSKTGGNVTSCADTDNSDSNVCTTSKDNNVNKDDNDKKSNSQDDLQEHKSKAVVKEEPLDGDDDNSSYEFVNNPCDDSDPLNEDSESNCANSGKNFSEVSIANVSSCNEAEANDGDDEDDMATKIKEELISELVTISEVDDDEGKIRVRPTQELMSVSSPDAVPLNSETAIYIIDGPACDEEMVNVSSLADKHDDQNDRTVASSARNFSNFVDNLFASEPTKAADCKQEQQGSFEQVKEPYSKVVMPSRQGIKKMKFKDRIVKQRKCKNRSTISIKVIPMPRRTQQSSFRKILPAPLKSAAVLPAPTLLPIPLAAPSTLSSSTAIFPPNQNRTPTKPITPVDASSSGNLTAPTTATFRMIAVPSPSTQSSLNVKRSLQLAAPKEDPSQKILLSRVVLLNSSDMQASTKQPVYTLAKMNNSPLLETKSKEMRQVAYVQTSPTPVTSSTLGKDLESATVAAAPAIASVTSKFRKIAPLPEGAVDIANICCKPCRTCFKLFTDKNELKKHVAVCCESFPKKGKKKNDVER